MQRNLMEAPQSKEITLLESLKFWEFNTSLLSCLDCRTPTRGHQGKKEQNYSDICFKRGKYKKISDSTSM